MLMLMKRHPAHPATARTNIDAVREIVAARRRKHPIRPNVRSSPRYFNRTKVWHTMITCICTSVQKSGRLKNREKSRVSKFVGEKPFPLRLEVCVGHENLRLFAGEVLASRGLRF